MNCCTDFEMIDSFHIFTSLFITFLKSHIHLGVSSDNSSYHLHNTDQQDALSFLIYFNNLSSTCFK